MKKYKVNWLEDDIYEVIDKETYESVYKGRLSDYETTNTRIRNR